MRPCSSKAAACSDCFRSSPSFLFELGETSLSIAGIVIAGFAVGGLFYTLTVSRFLPRLGVKGMMIAGATLVGLQLVAVAFGPELEDPGAEPAVHGLGLLHDPRLPAGVRQRIVGGSARHRAVAAFVLLLHGPDALARSPTVSASSTPARCRPCSTAAAVMIALGFASRAAVAAEPARGRRIRS